MLAQPRVLSPSLPVRQPALPSPSCATRRRCGRGSVAVPLRASSKEEAPQQGMATQQNQQELECTLSGMDNVECDYVDPAANPDRPPSTSSMQGEQQSAPDLVQVAGPLGLLVLISPFMFWGTSMVAMKGLMTAFSPLLMGSFRLLPSGFILVAVAAAQGRPAPSTLAAWAWVAAFALVDGACFQGFLAEGLQRCTAGLGSVIIDSQPLTVAVLAALLFGEALTPASILGLVLGVSGLLLLELPEDSLVNAGMRELLCLPCEHFVWPVAAGAPRGQPSQCRKKEDPQAITEVVQGLGPQDIASSLYVSLLGGAASYGIFFWLASSKGNLTALSSLTFLTPVFAAVTGYFVLGEVLTLPQIVGGAVTLSAVFLISGSKQKKAEESKELQSDSK
ncbi:Drug/Metabolite transporter superfamily [Dunaliella salina]|uniref:Drug/Metabolite transporter superfamily n=1 Tax=Dunaliella salina TaxID=3046 RepID=A0ABQ7GRG5_DUNSA|nr:Drug/Metabolite transporter superfamily [Dunaliella salina]|eukprot:KAF5837194.1 Drug/Metabolite transporter superfamily [Dunaliella salina]